MSDEAQGGNGNGNGNGSGGMQNLRVVNLETQTEKKKRQCVLKLKELLAQAEQGHYTDLIVIANRGASDPTGDHSLHWTNISGQEVRFIGALEVMKLVLLNNINITRS